MKKILVSILSDHLVPNYLFIKEMRGKFNDLLFIETSYVEEKRIASRLESALKKNEDSVSKVIVESDSYQDGLNSLRHANLPQDVYYIVNLTGGTKIMSLMVYEFFRGFNSSFYYIPIGKNTYCNIQDGTMCSLRYRISLKEYFTLYGLQFDCDNTCLKDKQTTFRLFEKQKERNFILSDEINYSHQAKKASDKRYYSGSWFEEYVYLRIKQELGLQDQYIAMSLKIYRNDFKHNDNEIDVAFMFENTLYIIECKVSMTGFGKGSRHTIENYLYKLAAISKDFGLVVRPYVFTLHKMENLSEEVLANIHKRMRILGVRKIISGTELSKPKIEL